MEGKVDKADVDKLEPVHVDLNRLSDVVNNDIVKKDVHKAKTQNIENKISDITNLMLKPMRLKKTNLILLT